MRTFHSYLGWSRPLAILAVLVLVLAACVPKPAGSVSFLEPGGAAQVISPFKVQLSVAGLTVEPAGTARDGYGHHHLIIDSELPPLDKPVPSDKQHVHLGKGQTEAVLDLPVGEHTLRLLFAKGDHIPYDPEVTATIKVTVTERRAVSFLEPQTGAQVTSPFTVRMGVVGVVVAPAAEGIHDGRGHHHIMVDTDLPVKGQPIPSDAQHIHFGKAQTETTLNLPAGNHTLTLLFAGGDHVPLDPPVTATISITVVQQ